jgi:hypothetical protein
MKIELKLKKGITMKKILAYILVLLVGIIGCSKEEPKTEAMANDGSRKIEVVEHMDGGGYTFLKANENGKEVWVAIRSMPVEVGDVYYFTTAMEMKNFESKSLNKTFESILFVDNVSKTPPSAAMGNSSGMPGMAGSGNVIGTPKVEANPNIKVTPLADGYSIEAVNKSKASLAGRTVKIKGVVTKYNASIMNRNWLHIQDGTSFGEYIDITVTSDQTAKVGDTIIIEGTVAVDKDFGAGYLYDVIVENASIVIDKEI